VGANFFGWLWCRVVGASCASADRPDGSVAMGDSGIIIGMVPRVGIKITGQLCVRTEKWFTHANPKREGLIQSVRPFEATTCRALWGASTWRVPAAQPLAAVWTGFGRTETVRVRFGLESERFDHVPAITAGLADG
jgi:hypothetical protein